MNSASHFLRPRNPFDFAKTLEFIGGFSPNQNEQETTSHSLGKALRIQGQTVVFRVCSEGTVQEPQLRVELWSENTLSEALQKAALDRISFYLSLDDDLAPFYTLAEEDPPFLKVVETLYGYHQVKFLTPWENAAWAILTQRTSTPVARTYKRRITERYSAPLKTPYGTFWAFPEPADLLGANLSELGGMTGGFRRNHFLLSAAQAFAQVDEGWLRTAPYAEARRWLRQIKGIGEWSSAFVLLRGLGRTERAILEDPKNPYVIRLLEAANRFYGPLSIGGLREKAAHYGPWQGYWAHYLRAVG